MSAGTYVPKSAESFQAPNDSDSAGTSGALHPAWRRIARVDASANVFYYHADHLGSTRTMTYGNGAQAGAVCYDADYTPYGQELQKANACPQNYKFTGYEHDSESGLDYAFFRHYNSRLGRFMSSDPLSGEVSNPQSLNTYSYVLNDPCSLVDPLGLRCTLTILIPDKLGIGAKDEITKIFDNAGVDIKFVSSGRAIFTVNQNVNIRDSNNPNRVIYGFASPPSTAYINNAEVDRKLFLLGGLSAQPSQALGRLISHEVGHLLLGGGHSTIGLMRRGAETNVEMFADPKLASSPSAFQFTDEQARSIQPKCIELNKPARGSSGAGNGGSGAGGSGYPFGWTLSAYLDWFFGVGLFGQPERPKALAAEFILVKH